MKCIREGCPGKTTSWYYDLQWTIYCKECYASGYGLHDTEEEAIEAWESLLSHEDDLRWRDMEEPPEEGMNVIVQTVEGGMVFALYAESLGGFLYINDLSNVEPKYWRPRPHAKR